MSNAVTGFSHSLSEPHFLRRSGGINAKLFVRGLRDIVHVPVEAQVAPFGIERFDQAQLLFPPPGFDLFLSLDCLVDVRVPLEVAARCAEQPS